jgi:hypothetical protein
MINYTVNSIDPEHYNRININLPNTTNWQPAILTATSLTCQYHLLILNDKEEWFRIIIREPMVLSLYILCALQSLFVVLEIMMKSSL